MLITESFFGEPEMLLLWRCCKNLNFNSDIVVCVYESGLPEDRFKFIIVVVMYRWFPEGWSVYLILTLKGSHVKISSFCVCWSVNGVKGWTCSHESVITPRCDVGDGHIAVISQSQWWSCDYVNIVTWLLSIQIHWFFWALNKTQCQMFLNGLCSSPLHIK